MTSLKNVADITFYNKETGEKIMEFPVSKSTDIKNNNVSFIPYNDLIPFKMEFDNCLEIQIFVTKETYKILLDYKANKIQSE